MRSDLIIVSFFVVLFSCTSLADPNQPPFIGDAGIYFSFEGEYYPDALKDSPCFFNDGAVAAGEAPSRLGNVSVEVPRVNSDGLKGQCYDTTHFTPSTDQSTLMWGEFSSDTPMENVLDEFMSFTVTCWVKLDPNSYYDHGRILKSPNLEIRYINQGRRLLVYLSSGEQLVSAASNKSEAIWGASDLWRFIAITYNGTQSTGNFSFYSATENDPVALDISLDVDRGYVGYASHGGNFWLGNLTYNSNSPFVGYMDELRVWTNSSDSSGALSMEQIEIVRKADLGISLCEGGILQGDVNFDCYVDILDFALMSSNWLDCNMEGDPSCGI